MGAAKCHLVLLLPFNPVHQPVRAVDDGVRYSISPQPEASRVWKNIDRLQLGIHTCKWDILRLNSPRSSHFVSFLGHTRYYNSPWGYISSHRILKMFGVWTWVKAQAPALIRNEPGWPKGDMNHEFMTCEIIPYLILIGSYSVVSPFHFVFKETTNHPRVFINNGKGCLDSRNRPVLVGNRNPTAPRPRMDAWRSVRGMKWS